jgi:hypothetical protein
MTPEFVPFPKIGRWVNNKIAITEKIDGTNGSIDIRIEASAGGDETILGQWEAPEGTDAGGDRDGPFKAYYVLRAGSRNRWLTRKADNYGFAKWVQENASELIKLGVGTHYGEWWGHGIQRGYGLEGLEMKYFSLFNVGRWADTPNGVYDKNSSVPDKQPVDVPGLAVVPRLYYGPLRDAAGNCMIEQTMKRLKFGGSEAVRGFKNPEGVMVYFEAMKIYSKAPFDPNPKGQV